MFEFFNPLLAGPVLPSTLLLGAMLLWSLLVTVIGVADHSLHHGMDSIAGHDGWSESLSTHSFSEAISGIGMVTLRWLNLRDMPLMLWLSVFSLLFWVVSLTGWLVLDQHLQPQPGMGITSVFVAKNLAISLPLTKLFTQPFRGWFESTHVPAKSLIGCECEISSSEANDRFGQVRFKTDGAPLLLNVRTDGPHLAKGSRVWITHYDSKRRVYIVSSTHTEQEL